MSQVLVIKTPEAAENPRLDEVRFGISGAKVADGQPSESATATATDGSQLVSPSPMWWDSADGGSADGPGGPGIGEPIEADNSSAAITVDASASAPADADDVVYPAYVDPDFTGGAQAWTLVDSAYPNSSYWVGSNRGADNQAHVGNISAVYSPDGRAHTDRTFWQLDTSALGGKHILEAHFNTQELLPDGSFFSNAFYKAKDAVQRVLAPGTPLSPRSWYEGFLNSLVPGVLQRPAR